MKDITEKKCTKCGEIKEVSAFSFNRKSIDGFSWYCKGCKNIANDEWRRKDPEKYAENLAEYIHKVEEFY